MLRSANHPAFFNSANTMLYGEANRCRLPLLPITENVFGGNGIQHKICTTSTLTN